MFVCVNVYVFMYACRTYICMYICSYVGMYVCLYVCLVGRYVCIVDIYVCICIDDPLLCPKNGPWSAVPKTHPCHGLLPVLEMPWNLGTRITSINLGFNLNSFIFEALAWFHYVLATSSGALNGFCPIWIAFILS